MYDLLKGIRVIDLSTVVLGPYATHLIAEMGADVIKVEPKGGDIFRAARPGKDGGDGAGFLTLNRNKRSIMLDLKHGDDQQILADLIRTADVFVHNMRGRSAAKLGIDYDAVKAVRSDVVYCSARGFGHGLKSEEPAYDDCIQSASGLAWLNADETGTPRFVRSVLCDKVTGLHLALAIAGGVAARARSGEGCFIETPMFEVMTAFWLAEHMSGQTFVPPLPERGYGRVTAPGRRPYPTKDGYATLMPHTARHWQRFFALIGRDDMAQKPELADDKWRSANSDMLYKLIEKEAPKRSTQEWLDAFKKADIPCADVNKLEDLVDDAHLRSADFFHTMTHPVAGELMYARTPFNMPTTPQAKDRPAPELDADREAILAELEQLL